MKGLSNVIAAILILVIMITLLVLTITTLQVENAQYSEITYVAENYEYFHDLMQTQLESHILDISYSVSTSNNGYVLKLTFQLNPNVDYSSSYKVNITCILMFNGNQISPLKTNYPIEVTISSTPYTLTFNSNTEPALYIIFQNGITVFVPPDSSV